MYLVVIKLTHQVDGGAFQVYCDFESFGGGWSLIFSSRDDNTQDNYVQMGDRHSAHITSLDPGNVNRNLAYDVLQAIEGSPEGYSEVMLTGYRDYDGKDVLCTNATTIVELKLIS